MWTMNIQDPENLEKTVYHAKSEANFEKANILIENANILAKKANFFYCLTNQWKHQKDSRLNRCL